MRVRAAGFGALLGLAITLAAGGCSRAAREAEADATQAPTVAVARVTRAPLARTLELPAEFRPFQEIDMHAKVTGFVKKIYVDVGDQVRTGQLLAVLEIPELQDEVTQAEAEVKRAQEEIRRAQADLKRAESSHEVAHLAYTRLAGVVKTRPDLVAQQEIDDAEGRDLQTGAQVDTNKAALAAADQQLGAARAGLARTRAMFAYAEMRAPFDGVVTKRYADTGTMLVAGASSEKQASSLVRLSQNGLLRLTVQAPESVVSLIHVGLAVTVRVPEQKKEFAGAVTRLAHMVTVETRTMDTEIDVPNPRLELVPGMYATVSLQFDSKADALAIPVESVQREGEAATALVVNAHEQIEERTVKTGMETTDQIEILSGLREGELVVLGGRSRLRAGQKVRTKIMQPPPAEGNR